MRQALCHSGSWPSITGQTTFRYDTFISMRQTLIALLFACGLTAQTKVPPSPADYGQWETLVEPGGGGGRGGAGVNSGGLSPDGKWLVYGINRSNGNNELRVTEIGTGTTKTTAFGAQ